MSEHIQPAADPTSQQRERTEDHERTPGVAHESEAFHFRLVIWVGVCLAAIVIGVQIILWWLLGGLEKFNAIPTGRVSELAPEETTRPLGQRVDNVPGPHLEGIERESSLLVLRTDDGDEKRFYTSVDVRIRIDNEKARLFQLREGQRVTIAYYMPGGTGGGLGVVTSVTYPPVKAELKKLEPELPETTRTLNGEILKVEPRSIAASREWAEVQSERYGWIDRDKEIVHIPVEKAMEEVLRSKKLGSTKEGRERKRPKESGGKR
ncbi:MAG TPA: hypothetical protein VE999_04575 [Gemmataceae bacterium]|nr:hypothetical protein [Gemmataceae bacterium]